MTFHEYKNGMTVMEGGRSIAVARDRGRHGWVLTHYAGCWVDARKSRFPNLLQVKTRDIARNLLRNLTEGASQ